MLETPRLSTTPLKKYIKANISLLPTLTFSSISSEGIQIFKKFFSFIDLGLHFDLCENEIYSTFVAKAGFFYAQKSIKETTNFLQIEIL